ncbi:hypothetical protein F4824DRAFT_70116 [Ustulina deusta]|nr:hypothetical protein F4824DRAFT_302861 [Ustulina deusta]KAI3339057.1 hypothetical protein F4824DRAFT_70116 [Ustulina deusta]
MALWYRPPTPYPFPSDPSWEAIGKLRSNRYPPYVKNLKESARTIERVTYERPRIYRHVAPHDIDSQVPSSRDRRDGVPRLSEVPNSNTNHRPAYSRPRLAERRRSAIGATGDPDVQRQILAQNARIAQRPHPSSHQARRADARGRADRKKVRFQLPGRRPESHHSGADLVGQFERLQVEDSRSSTRCSSCGQLRRQ